MYKIDFEINAAELLIHNPWLETIEEAQKLIDALACDPADCIVIDWEND